MPIVDIGWQDLGGWLNETFLGGPMRCFFGVDWWACRSSCSFNKASPVIAFASVSFVRFLASLASSILLANAVSSCVAQSSSRYAFVNPPIAALANLSTSVCKTGSSTALRRCWTCWWSWRTARLLAGVAGAGRVVGLIVGDSGFGSAAAVPA